MDIPAAARGAYEVAVSSMTKAVKAVTSERGRDPREAVMVAFGGAGPLYGAAIARELGIDTVIVPVHTGLFSSLGLLVADTERQAVAPHRADLDALDLLGAEFDRMAKEVTEALREAAPSAHTEVQRVLDMRYRGQRFELSVTVPDGKPAPGLMASVRRRFHAEHHRTYGRAGWRSLFFTEGLFTVLSGTLIYGLLPDRPADAKWLTPQEKDAIQRRLTLETAQQNAHGALTGMRQALSSGRVWMLSFAFFAIVFGLYPIAFFLPTMIATPTGNASTISDVSSVLLAGIPSAIAIVAMLARAKVAARRSVVFSTAVPLAFGVVGLLLATFTHDDVLFIGAFCVSVSGVFTYALLAIALMLAAGLVILLTAGRKAEQSTARPPCPSPTTPGRPGDRPHARRRAPGPCSRRTTVRGYDTTAPPAGCSSLSGSCGGWLSCSRV
ncbi:MFS transporter [Streptomyces sp. Inha503]|uniref:MFS transporter n=1 Tax=Streptomyces sp. Inha503 TaxID=3383314 RepID=UPI0039A2308E